MSGYAPLVVRCELQAPVIMDHWQPLDGILGSAIIADPDGRETYRRLRSYRRMVAKFGLVETARIYGERGWQPPGEDQHFLPLAVWGHGVMHGLWVYCSSWAIPSEHESDLVYLTKRLDFEQVDTWVEPKGRVEIGKGEFVPQWLPLETRNPQRLTWFVVGEAARILEALQTVSSIGKKRHRGFGTVRLGSWSVEPATEDRSVFAPDGVIMRPIPVQLLEQRGLGGDYDQAYTTYRPPYHEPRWACTCAVAGRVSG